MLNYMVVYTEKIVNISQVMQYRVEILVDNNPIYRQQLLNNLPLMLEKRKGFH